MAYLNDIDPETALISAEIASDKGKELNEAYRSATPFPNIQIDDFLPEALLDRCLAEFPTHLGQEGVAYARAQERRKYQYMPDSLTPTVRAMFYAFNSRPFIRILENITGINGLIPDPYFLGAGLHEIKQGGHLSIHADFNHHKPLNLERRINILIYLNKEWRNEYGGQLELWDKSMQECVHSILPLFGRCVIFNTTEQSNHGNPHPINHPGGVSRKSIALYYYTSTWGPREREHTTQFRVRPDSKDSIDWKVHMKELLADVAPPLLYRAVRKVKRQLSGARD
jgi:Rps23 Pro-64 3,4-dihydroxylase Tpa1-like proline 4-hydroxylase